MFSNLGWDAVEIWVFVYVYPHSLKSHNGLPWKPWISYNQTAFYFEDDLSGPNEHIYTHNEMSYVFNLGLITPLHTIVYPWCVPSFFKISLIFMNMQMK